jgi:tyrosine kinase 3/solute carrier family 25 phosphate transporter 23/24/25/41
MFIILDLMAIPTTSGLALCTGAELSLQKSSVLVAMGCELTSMGCELTSMGCELTSMGCELTSMGCELTSMGCELTSMGCELTSGLALCTGAELSLQKSSVLVAVGASCAFQLRNVLARSFSDHLRNLLGLMMSTH